MKIQPVTQKKHLLYPMAAAVALAGCQQQTVGMLSWPPLDEQVVVDVKPPQEEAGRNPQRLVGRRAVRQGRVKNQPLPGKRRATR